MTPLAPLVTDTLTHDAYARYVSANFDSVPLVGTPSSGASLAGLVHTCAEFGLWTMPTPGTKAASDGPVTTRAPTLIPAGVSPAVNELAREVVTATLTILSRMDLNGVDSAALRLPSLTADLVTLMKANNSVPMNVLGLQVFRRLCGLASPSALKGKPKGTPVLHTARVAELAAANAFRDIAHTFMSHMEDVAYIREAIRLLQVRVLSSGVCARCW